MTEGDRARDLRRFEIARARLAEFRTGRLPLRQLLADLEGVIETLEQVTPEWRDRFVRQWSVLEDVYGAFWDRLQTQPTIRDREVAAVVDTLEEVLTEAISGDRQQGRHRGAHPEPSTGPTGYLTGEIRAGEVGIGGRPPGSPQSQDLPPIAPRTHLPPAPLTPSRGQQLHEQQHRPEQHRPEQHRPEQHRPEQPYPHQPPTPSQPPGPQHPSTGAEDPRTGEGWLGVFGLGGRREGGHRTSSGTTGEIAGRDRDGPPTGTGQGWETSGRDLRWETATGRGRTAERPAVPALRTAVPSDYEAIASVADVWWGRPVLASLPRLFLDHFHTTSLVAESPSGMVGFLVGFGSPSQPWRAYVHFVAVAPQVRRTGLARRLYEAFLDRMRAEGRTTITAITSPGNSASIAFHQALGFTVTGPVAGYDGPGTERILFERRLF